MRIRHADIAEDTPINMTPMIDMVFLLLIFFLVATTFAQGQKELEKERTVQLPGTDPDVPLSATPSQDFTINISKDGAAVVKGKAREYDELSAMLTELAESHPDRNVLIRADERCLMKYYAEVVDLCHRAGLSEQRIAYVPKSVVLGPGD